MTIKDIYDGLQDGKRYILKSDFMLAAELYANGTHRFYAYSPNLYKTVCGNIGWQHYGSSANKNTLKDLTFIIKDLFEKTADDFIEMPEQ